METAGQLILRTKCKSKKWRSNMKKLLICISASILLISSLPTAWADATKQLTKSDLKSTVVTQPAPVVEETRAGEKIDWQVLSSGGTSGSSTAFILNGTVNQTAVGPGTSTNFKLNSGFWQNFTTFVCDGRPGDANNTNNFNALDITYLINFLYKHGPVPKPYALLSGDANCNCAINALDITYLINFLYKHGSATCDCPTWISHCGMPLRK